jgi:hypothetical protein
MRIESRPRSAERFAELATDVVRCYVLGVRATSSLLRLSSRRSERATLKCVTALPARAAAGKLALRGGLHIRLCEFPIDVAPQSAGGVLVLQRGG